MSAGYQRRGRWTIEELAQAGRIAADMTEAERRPVTGDEVLRLAALYGMHAMRRCMACTQRVHCSVHGPLKEEPAKAPSKAEPAHIRYASAYAQGQQDATSGEPFAPPTDSRSREALVKMAVTHGTRETAAGRSDVLRGAELLTWFRETSAAYRRARAAEPDYESGFNPVRCLAWLNAGRPEAGARKGTTTRQKAPIAVRQRGETL